MPMPDFVEWDPEQQILTIDGVRYARDVFRALSTGADGKLLRIVGRTNGVVHLEFVNPPSAP